MPATIFSGNNVKALKSNLDLNGVTKILSVNADPASGAGVAAPLGSIAMDYLAGKVYKKTGSLDTEWQELGSGIGGINYIENSDAESGTAGWSTYADAAGSAPVDGTGGTANITWSRSTTSPLRGVADFNLVKDAVNRQGQGVSYDFTIDSADQAKILTISADYEVLSGTFATGDLAVYVIQDPAGTPVVLQPAGYQVTAGTNGNKLRLAATFQTASNVTSYRLCIHVASVSALAYTLAFDSVAVSPQQVVYGAPVTDWQDYTPVITAVTTNPTLGTTTVNKARWRRVGDSMQIEYQVKQTSAGTAGSGLYFFALPSGYAVDSSKLGYFSAHDGVAGAGSVTIQTASTAGTGSVYAYDATRLACLFVADSIGAGGVTWGSANFAFSNAALTVSFTAQVPILGWSSSVVVSSSTDTRVVAARFNTSTARTTNNTAPAIIYDVVQYDTHGAYNSSTGTYVVPVSGQYKVSAFALWSATASTVGHSFSLQLKRNGTFVSNICGTRAQTTALATFDCSGSTTFNLNAGDSLTFGGYSDTASTTIASQPLSNWVCVERISGPSQIAASESVAMRAYNTSGFSVPNNSVTTITGWTTSYDTHGAFNASTGIYTVPVSGKYRVSGTLLFASSALVVGQPFSLIAGQSGSVSSNWVCGQSWAMGNVTTAAAAGGSDTIQCLAGDTIAIRAYQSQGAARSLSTSATENHFEITRVGN